MAKKTWAQKMESGGDPEIETAAKDFSWVKAGTRILILNPRIVRDRVAKLGVGEFKTPAELREEWAGEYGADMTCPLTVGIFLRIVSEAAWDEHLAGAPLDSVTPFWRVVDPKSPLAKKLRCGQEFLAEMRAREAA
ncbi:MAG: hypothetical protein JNM28_01120 [Armatimonadetes bacterium]|nr:hypothetical protein [Armatimonadota bacterium]MBS1711091.1 hypothetical protein [Armatimonadota bacterium]MBX3108763.1 hypothetical protein [Fimbriimonadaceae bacterium]